MIRSYNDLEVYKSSYKLAMDIFQLCLKFPKEERYSLTSQIIRSSRSISANISEGWAKREYEQVFKNHLINALGSVSETQTWLYFALDCEYINKDEFEILLKETNEISMMLTKLHQNWKTK